LIELSFIKNHGRKLNVRISNHLLAAFVCAGMTMSVTAVAQTAAPAAVSSPSANPNPAKPAAAEKRICKESEVVGSRFPKRICLTAQQWAERQQDDQDWIKKAQTSGYTNGN